MTCRKAISSVVFTPRGPMDHDRTDSRGMGDVTESDLRMMPAGDVQGTSSRCSGRRKRGDLRWETRTGAYVIDQTLLSQPALPTASKRKLLRCFNQRE